MTSLRPIRRLFSALWSTLRRLLQVLALATLSAVLLCGGYALWFYLLRGQPEPVHRALFEGISYRRLVRQEPRPLVAHQIEVTVGSPGVRFLVTPPRSSGRRPLRGQTTGAFLAEHGLQLAINGDFFRPWHSRLPWDYYPKTGDPVQVLGHAVSGGKAYAPPTRGKMALYISCDQRPSFRRPSRLCQAISGMPLLRGGRRSRRWPNEAVHPRTAVGLDRHRRRLILLVVDGRQPGHSEGASLAELARLMLELGAHDAINLDGGGSSTLVAADHEGRPTLLNSPMHTRIVGRQRPVANHLGIAAKMVGQGGQTPPY